MSRRLVNDVQLNVEISGDGSPLLLLHGFTGSVATWQPHLPALTARHLVIAVDMLGHGQSDAPDEPGRYDITNLSADLAALLTDLNVEQTAVLGYSMGGRVALYFALHYPALINRLILESASPGLVATSERAVRVESDNALADFIEQAGLSAFVDRWERLPLWASQATLPPSLKAILHQQRLTNSPVGLANSLRGLGTGVQVSLWERLPDLAQPTLLIAGASDLKFTGIAKEMADLLPAARLEIVPQAGHAVHLEQPVIFDQLIGGFLQQVAKV